MKARPLTWLSTAALAATLLCTGNAGYTTAAAPGGDPSGQSAGRLGAPQDIARFTAALQKKGFAVQNGQLARMDFVSLCCSGEIPTCECNNAGAPYHDRPGAGCAGQAPTGSPLLFRLAANEAIIIVGRTPPPMSCFPERPVVPGLAMGREAADLGGASGAARRHRQQPHDSHERAGVGPVRQRRDPHLDRRPGC